MALLGYGFPAHVFVAGVRHPTRGSRPEFERAVEANSEPPSRLLVVGERPPHP